MHRLLTILFFTLVSLQLVLAQPTQPRVQIVITPDRDDWIYKAGEQPNFHVKLLKYGIPVRDVVIKYEIGPEQMIPAISETQTVASGKTTLSGATMDTPGFLRCIVTCEHEGRTYRNLATVGFDVDSIKPTVERPDDFSAFWEQAKDSLEKIPMDTRMTLIPERCTEKVNTYEVNLQNFGKTRLYGIVCIPKAPGKYPAQLIVPGAGVRGYLGDVATAEKGMITFEIGIHGLPVTMKSSVYEILRSGALRDYYNYNLDNRDRFYYKRVYLGCVRANDFLTTLPEYDGRNLAVLGGSQGGALAIVTAALDDRVKAVVSIYPALADMTGYLHGRAGGWPHYLDRHNLKYNHTKEKQATIPYYDVVNFAKELNVPISMTWGFNDEVCPPTTAHAVYNSITSPKQVSIYNDTGHWTYPEQYRRVADWLHAQLGVK